MYTFTPASSAITKSDHTSCPTATERATTTDGIYWAIPKQSGRSSGRALLSTTGKLVGSLHLDTSDAQPGAEIECVIVARAFKPMFGSALDPTTVGSRDLFWVMYVVPSARDGIVERRGIGQILCEAFEEMTMGMAEVKTILLG